MQDDLTALFLALGLFLLLAVWVPFLAFLQFARKATRAKDPAQIRSEDRQGLS